MVVQAVAREDLEDLVAREALEDLVVREALEDLVAREVGAQVVLEAGAQVGEGLLLFGGDLLLPVRSEVLGSAGLSCASLRL